MARAYDFSRGRWSGFRPYPLRWSDMVLGRRATQAFLLKNGEVCVSAYLYKGTMRYSGPCLAAKKKQSKVLYRIKVKLKEGVL